VKQTRYTNVNAGGSSPKDGLEINKNPGPGQYHSRPSMADTIDKRLEINKNFY
jgi:hypothetical protein